MSQLERAVPLSTAPKHRSFCFYGPAGSGKSTAMTMHPGRGFVIDSNAKLHEMDNITPDTRQRITIWQPSAPLSAEDIRVTTVDPKRRDPREGAARQWSVIPKGYAEIIEVTNDLLKLAIKCKKENEPFPYDWIGHDSLTHTMAHMNYAVMQRHGVNMLTQTLYDVVKRDIMDYLDGWLRLGRIAGVDTIFICHSREYIRMDDDGRIVSEKTKPNIVGQLRDELFTHFTEVYYFRGGSPNGKWYIQTYTDGKLEARTSRKLAAVQEVDAKVIY